MSSLVPLEPVDYLVIGHLSCDITPEGPRLGGTAAYAALTSHALGLRVGSGDFLGWRSASGCIGWNQNPEYSCSKKYIL